MMVRGGCVYAHILSLAGHSCPFDFGGTPVHVCVGCLRFLFSILQFRDEAGKEIGSDKCYLIGSDGGIIPNAGNHKLPKAGLLTDVAYRWDIICDFTGYSKDVSNLLCMCALARC